MTIINDIMRKTPYMIFIEDITEEDVKETLLSKVENNIGTICAYVVSEEQALKIINALENNTIDEELVNLNNILSFTIYDVSPRNLFTLQRTGDYRFDVYATLKEGLELKNKNINETSKFVIDIIKKEKEYENDVER